MADDDRKPVTPHYLRSGGCHMVFDSAAVDTIDSSFFEVAHWEREGAVLNEFSGRGKVHQLRHGSAQWVLRHCRRGGLIGRFIYDSYFWLGLKRARAWREWHLLADLYQFGLPVPRPIAARVVRHGLWYRADLISQMIQDVEPLAETLLRRSIPNESWEALGQTVARFHRFNIHHTDLNARNILWQSPAQFFLIDFDGSGRKASDRQRRAEVQRLRRSLDKFAGRFPGFHFDESNWQSLLSGYAAPQDFPGRA